MDNTKKGSLKPIFFIMMLSMFIAFFWDKLPFIKDYIHYAFDPSLGELIKWNLNIGMAIIVFFISVITTLIQKYATDQKALKELREEQKILQEEMKKYRDNPQKTSELSKKQLEFFPRTFRLTSRSIMFTGIPLILLYRWFNDTFTAMGNPLFLGFLSWFLFYLIFAMVFSSILRKVFKVV